MANENDVTQQMRVKHLSERSAARDTLEVPNLIQKIAENVSAIMRQAGVSKVEVINKTTVYVNTLDDRVYVFDTDGAVTIRNEFRIVPR